MSVRSKVVGGALVAVLGLAVISYGGGGDVLFGQPDREDEKPVQLVAEAWDTGNVATLSWTVVPHGVLSATKVTRGSRNVYQQGKHVDLTARSGDTITFVVTTTGGTVICRIDVAGNLGSKPPHRTIGRDGKATCARVVD